MNFAYIALGSNLNQPLSQLDQAIEQINLLEHITVLKKSSFYITEPIDCPEGSPDFINAVIYIQTSYSSYELLIALQQIERDFGRVRHQLLKNTARTLDLDILLYNQDMICFSSDLIVPHPRMHERAFVLYPLLEIAPDCEIPNLGKAIRFLDHCKNQEIKKFNHSLEEKIA